MQQSTEAPTSQQQQQPIEQRHVAVLDLEVVAQLDELGPGIRSELAALYALDATQRLADLRAAGDAATAATAAHALKGASLAIGARGVTARAAAVEARAQQGQAPAPGDLAALRVEVDAALSALATT